MSRKNLSRSLIEGGRYSGNKTDRYISNAEERARVRNYIQEVTLDPENYDEYDVEPREHVYKGFKDKLGPMYRWLQSQVGRPWDDVRSEVFQKFDIRTTAGRHIVFDHLLNSVTVGEEPPYRYSSNPDDPTTSYSDHDYYVDEDGALQKKRYLGRRRYSEKVPVWDTKQLANWLNGRIIGQVGNKLFWFVPTGKGERHGRQAHGDYAWKTLWGYPRDPYYYYSYSQGLRWEYLTQETVYKTDSMGNVIYDEYHRATPIGTKKVWKAGSRPFLRQGRKLNTKELEYWHNLPNYYKIKVLEESPTYPEELKRKPRYYY
jgi:hypothetical protein